MKSKKKKQRLNITELTLNRFHNGHETSQYENNRIQEQSID